MALRLHCQPFPARGPCAIRVNSIAGERRRRVLSAAPSCRRRLNQHNWACFLAEQSAQLALKAVLHGIGAGAWGHDLLVLGHAVQQAVGPQNDQWVAALRRLSRHYIPTRYPDAHPSGPPEAYYGREDVEDALADLQLILQIIDTQWTALPNAS